MKVLMISAAFPPLRAGEADHVFHLCQHLADGGVDLHVLTAKAEVPAGGLPFTVYPLIRDWTWSDLPRLTRFIGRCSPDAVLLMYSGGPIYNYHPMITFAPSLAKFLLPGTPF